MHWHILGLPFTWAKRLSLPFFLLLSACDKPDSCLQDKATCPQSIASCYLFSLSLSPLFTLLVLLFSPKRTLLSDERHYFGVSGINWKDRWRLNISRQRSDLAISSCGKCPCFLWCCLAPEIINCDNLLETGKGKWCIEVKWKSSHSPISKGVLHFGKPAVSGLWTAVLQSHADHVANIVKYPEILAYRYSMP